MIDNFALALSHGVLMLAAWRLLFRPDLDEDAAEPNGAVKPSWRIRRNKGDAPGA